jgi:hypothetical protein
MIHFIAAEAASRPYMAKVVHQGIEVCSPSAVLLTVILNSRVFMVTVRNLELCPKIRQSDAPLQNRISH